MQLFDSHAHIQGNEFTQDLPAVIARAAAAGVCGIVMPAVDLETAEAAATLTSSFKGLYAGASFHPHEANRFDVSLLPRLRELLADPNVVAVGECGLDYYRLHSTREEQLAAFAAMLKLAEESGKPLIIHARDAWQDLAAVLQPWARDMAGCKAGQPLGVLHYFSSDLADAETYFDLGFLISIHTSVTHPRAQALRDVAAALPLEALLIETDSPYGAPQSQRGKRNEPAYVSEAAATIAAVRGLEPEEVARVTTANALRLFGIKANASPRVVGAAA